MPSKVVHDAELIDEVPTTSSPTDPSVSDAARQVCHQVDDLGEKLGSETLRKLSKDALAVVEVVQTLSILERVVGKKIGNRLKVRRNVVRRK